MPHPTHFSFSLGGVHNRPTLTKLKNTKQVNYFLDVHRILQWRGGRVTRGTSTNFSKGGQARRSRDEVPQKLKQNVSVQFLTFF